MKQTIRTTQNAKRARTKVLANGPSSLRPFSATDRNFISTALLSLGITTKTIDLENDTRSIVLKAEAISVRVVNTILTYFSEKNEAISLFWAMRKSDVELKQAFMDFLRFKAGLEPLNVADFYPIKDASILLLRTTDGSFICCLTLGLDVKLDQLCVSQLFQFDVLEVMPDAKKQIEAIESRRVRHEMWEAALEAEGVPSHAWPACIVTIRHVRGYTIEGRPKWNDREGHDGLNVLTAPKFLRHVHDDDIVENHVYKETIRSYDPDLMNAVEGYISQRERRSSPLGDAANLVLVASKPATNKATKQPSRPSNRSRAADQKHTKI